MSKKRRKTKTPNYLSQLRSIKPTGAGLHRVEIQHDDWCDKLNGKGPCNCNPIVGRPERIQ